MAAKDFELILRVQADLQQAVSQLRTLNDQMRVTKSAAVQASGGLSGITSSAKSAEAGIRGVGTQLTGINAKFASVNRAAHDLRNAFVFAFAAHEVVRFTASLVDANKEAQRIQYTMQQVFGAQGAQEQLQFVHGLAEQLGLDFKSAAEGFASFAANAQGTGIQTADLRKLFTGLSEAATVLHASTADVNGVFIQLGQAMSLGKLQMQDIRAIAQHLPGTMTLLSEAAKRMGTDLTTALKSGGLEAKRFIGVLGDVLHERFGVAAVEASHSLNSELNRLHTTLFTLQTDGTGFAGTFADAIRDLNTTLSDPSIQASLKDLIGDLGKIASFAIRAAGAIGELANKIGNGIGTGLGELVTGVSNPSDAIEVAEHKIKTLNDEIADFQARLDTANANANKPTWIKRVLGIDDGASVDKIKEKLAQLRAQLKLTEQYVSNEKAHPTVFVSPKPKPTATGTGAGTGGAGGAGTPDPAAIKRAAETARQAASAQDALTQSLISLQGELDPTAAIYAKYNAAVEKATQEAELAKKAHGANAQAIDAQRDAVVALAGKVRDAALDQLAEKDRQAWDALRRSFETPAEVRVEDALKQIAQLNDMLKTGVINAQQYQDALGQIGQKSVAGALPSYQGIDASVGGTYGELQKNYQAQADLDAAYRAQKHALDKQFDDSDEAQHAAHLAALTQLDEDRAKQQKRIDDARGSLQLDAASSLFGQLAQLSTSHNKKMAAIGKAAAVAQAIIETYKSANEAYSALALIPYIGPALGAAAAAAAIVAGLANVAQIRSQNVGGYSEGGMTPPGGKYQIAGIVHAGEGVLSQDDIAALGGPASFHALRRSLRGYADGGFVSLQHPLANAPSPAALGLTAPRSLPVGAIGGSAANGGAAQQPPPDVHVYAVFDPAELADKVMNSGPGHKVIINVAGDNPRAIQGKWQG